MIRRRLSARRGARGIALAEALVALAIASMTLLLLTTAGWGLRHADERRTAAEATDAADWLAARRILHGWAGGLTAARDESAGMRILGTASTARMILSSVAAGLPQEAVAELRIEEADGHFSLVALRYPSDRDVRTASGGARETRLIETDMPMRLTYLLPSREGGRAPIWRYESHPETMPLAIALEVGNARRIVAPVFPDRSAACVAAVGIGGLEEPRCALR